MTYKEFMERRKQVENSVVNVEAKPSVDYNLLSNLLDYFYEDVAQKQFNEFLKDHGYSAEDYVKCMSEVRKMI